MSESRFYIASLVIATVATVALEVILSGVLVSSGPRPPECHVYETAKFCVERR